MKRVVLMTVALAVFAAGFAYAQNPADEAYIKAMQANSPAERAKLLKDYIGQFAGKGGQYDNFAYAQLCLVQLQLGKLDAETVGYGEKALSLGGFDELTKGQVQTGLAAISMKMGQTDKAKTFAAQVIQTATANKGKEAEAANAAAWNQMLGGGYYLQAQALGKSGDIKGALDSYGQAYKILNAPAILGELSKMAKTMADGKKYAEAEQVYRFLAATGKDPNANNQLARLLYQQGKKPEALAMFKDIFDKQKKGETAYNIGILLANEAKTDPSLSGDAINYLLYAGLLGTSNPKQAQQAMDIAQSMFMSQDKEWNSRVKAIQESNKLIEEWTKTINDKFGDKSEDELTPEQRRESRQLNENINKEKKIGEGIQAQQKATMDKWNKVVAEAKTRLGK